MNYYLLEQYFLNQRKTRQTIDSYLFHIRNFIDANPAYETYGLNELTFYIADLNQKYKREDGRVTTTAAIAFYSIKSLYQYLVRTGRRDELPFPHSFSIRGTRTRGLNTKKIFSTDELQGLMNFVKSEKLRYEQLELRNQVVISLLIYQALQSSEIINLNNDDVDLDTGTIRIGGSPSANGRILNLHPSQYLILNNYIRETRPRLLQKFEYYKSSYPKLVIGMRAMTEQVAGIGTLLRRYRLLYPEREMTASSIRQSVIYHWLNTDKKSLEEVQQLAGHKWPSSTEKYISKVRLEDPELINRIHPMERLKLQK